MISATRAALAISLVTVGATVGACSTLLGVDDVQYAGADGTVATDGGGANGDADAGATGPGGDGGRCKVCVVCVDAADPNVGCAEQNCQPCPIPANGTATCAAGACSISCTAPFLDCNQDAGDGCEVDRQTDPANCGGCGKRCAGQVCNKGLCQDTCGGGLTNCDGGCVDLDASAQTCGACNAPCLPENNATPVCVAGKCSLTCSKGFEDCNHGVSDGCECDLATRTCTGNVCITCSAAQATCLTVGDCCTGGDPSSVACMIPNAGTLSACCIKKGFPFRVDKNDCCSLSAESGLCL